VSSLAKLQEVCGFFSYSRRDDRDSGGRLSKLRDAIVRELSSQLGRNEKTFQIFQDQQDIPRGALWEKEIENAINRAVFFIPIVTPRAVSSDHCKFEFEWFLLREGALGRDDLVFPILYYPVPELNDDTADPVLSIIRKRQYVDWDLLRYREVTEREYGEGLYRFCRDIANAIRAPWLSPEERREQEEIAAELRAEDERKRREVEARQRAEEKARRKQEEQEAREAKEAAEVARKAEEVRRAAEAIAARRADEERRKQEEAEAQRLAAQEERRLKDAAEAKERAEEEARRKQEADRLAREARQREEAEAARKAEEDRRIAAAAAAQRAEQERLAKTAATVLQPNRPSASLAPPKPATNWGWWVGAILVGGAIYWHWVGFGGGHSNVSAVAPTPSAIVPTAKSPALAAPQKSNPLVVDWDSLKVPTEKSPAPAAPQPSNAQLNSSAGITFTMLAGDISVSGKVEDDTTRNAIAADLKAAFGVFC
jgi:hypothetical protein